MEGHVSLGQTAGASNFTTAQKKGRDEKWWEMRRGAVFRVAHSSRVLAGASRHGELFGFKALDYWQRPSRGSLFRRGRRNQQAGRPRYPERKRLTPLLIAPIKKNGAVAHAVL
jgi:hypothetical protein